MVDRDPDAFEFVLTYLSYNGNYSPKILDTNLKAKVEAELEFWDCKNVYLDHLGSLQKTSLERILAEKNFKHEHEESLKARELWEKQEKKRL